MKILKRCNVSNKYFLPYSQGWEVTFDHKESIFADGSIHPTGACLTSTRDEGKANTLKISPNPSRGTLRILTDELDFQSRIVEIYNLQGQQLLKTQYVENEELNLSQFSNGTYLIRLLDEAGIELGRQQWIKQ